jgi:hypothetical protein
MRPRPPTAHGAPRSGLRRLFLRLRSGRAPREAWPSRPPAGPEACAGRGLPPAADEQIQASNQGHGAWRCPHGPGWVTARDGAIADQALRSHERAGITALETTPPAPSQGPRKPPRTALPRPQGDGKSGRNTMRPGEKKGARARWWAARTGPLPGGRSWGRSLRSSSSTAKSSARVRALDPDGGAEGPEAEVAGTSAARTASGGLPRGELVVRLHRRTAQGERRSVPHDAAEQHVLEARASVVRSRPGPPSAPSRGRDRRCCRHSAGDLSPHALRLHPSRARSSLRAASRLPDQAVGTATP